jgi:hypothetical protein
MTIVSLILTYLAGLFGTCYVQANPIMHKTVPVAIVERMATMGPRRKYNGPNE